MLVMVVLVVAHRWNTYPRQPLFTTENRCRRAGMILRVLGVTMFYQHAAPTGLEGIIFRVLGEPVFYKQVAPLGLKVLFQGAGVAGFLQTCRPAGA